MTLLALLAATSAAALVFPATPSLPRTRQVRRWAWWPLALGASAAGMAVLRGQVLVLALVAAGFGCGCLWLARRSRARAAADANRTKVVEACEALASELRAGQPPTSALQHAATVWASLGPVAAAARLDADVPTAFRRAGSLPGASALVEVAAAWQVAQSVGAGLAQALDRVVDQARGELATHRVVAAELASAQATARLVALLPVVLLVLSDGTGAQPWQFLTATGPGLACLATGLGLALAGMAWIDRIVTRVQAGPL